MKQPYIRPFGRPIREPLWLRCVKWLGKMLLALALGLLMVVFLLEWMAGCGETYIDAKGERHAYECIFIKR